MIHTAHDALGRFARAVLLSGFLIPGLLLPDPPFLSAQVPAALRSDSAYLALGRMPADTMRVHRMNAYAQELNVRDPNLGLFVAREALKMAEKIRFLHGQMKAYSLMAFGYLSRPAFDSARFCLLKSIAIAEKMGHKEGLSLGYGGMGNVYYFESKFPQAIEWWIKALRMHEARKDTTGMVASMSNLGAVYLDLGKYDDAMRNFQQALALNRASGQLRNRAEILSNIASIYGRENKIQLAESHQLEALEVARKLKSIDLEAACLADLSNTYRRKKMLRKALEYAQQSLGLCRMISSSDGIAFAQLLIGQCYWHFVDQKEQEWLQQHFSGNSRNCLLASLRFHDSALAIYKELAMLDRMKTVYESKSAVQKSLGDGMGAFESFKLAAELKDSLFNMDLDKRLTQATMQYEYDKKTALAQAEQERINTRERNVRNTILAGLFVSLAFGVIVWFQRNRIRKAQQRSEELLLNILPAEVAEELKTKGEAEARLMESVSVLFTDFKGFTAMSEQLSPKELVRDLHACFTAFDYIMQKYGLEKIKTIGDAYMAAGGLPTPVPTHAADVVAAALEIRQFIEDGKAEKKAAGLPYFEVRIGIHTGPVVAGIVGVKKFSYDIWGDTVNTASRMESFGEVGKVNISASTYQVLQNNPLYTFEARGKIAVKGKGEVEMYFVEKAKG